MSGRLTIARLVWCGIVSLMALLVLGMIVVSADNSWTDAFTSGERSRDVRLKRAVDALTVGAGAVALPAIDLHLARDAAVSEPLSPVPFYVLGASGHVRDPAAAVSMALRRDPRFLPAYRWQVANLAKRGDIAGATRALIRIGVLMPYDERIWSGIANLTADPRARRVIKDELARGAAWRASYFALLSASSVDRAVVYEMLQTSGMPASPSKPGSSPNSSLPELPHARRDFIAAMVSRKEYERAYLAWVQWLPVSSLSGVGNVFDGDLQGLSALPPFAWSLSDGVGGAVTLTPSSGLTLDYSGSDEAILAQQMVLLPPGRYRIITDARFDVMSSDGDAPLLVWALTCADDQRALTTLAVPLVGASRRMEGAPFTVDGTCAAQMLILRVNASDFAKRLSGHIRSIKIEAVPT